MMRSRAPAMLHDQRAPYDELERRLNALYRADEVIDRSRDLQGLLEGLVEVAAEVFQTEKSAIVAWDESRTHLFVLASVGYDPEFARQIRFPPDQSEIGRVASSGESVAVEDASSDARADLRVIEAESVRAFIHVPIKIDDAVYGVFNVSYGEQRKIPSEDVRLFEALAHRAASAISYARLLERLQAQVHALEQSESQYRQLVENVNDVVYALDANGRFSFLSRHIKKVVGYDPEELLGQPVASIVVAESLPILQEHFALSMKDPAYRASYPLQMWRKDGEVVHFEVSVATMLVDGKPVEQQGIARDITERIQLEQEVARRQTELLASRQRQMELQDYVALTTRAVEEERRRIARDLHDETAQEIVAISRRLESLAQAVPISKEMAVVKVSEIQDMVDRALSSVRRFSRDLRPAVLDDLGLLPALEWLLGELKADQTHAMAAYFEMVGQPRRLPAEVELSLFRIAQEALQNVRKHSQATIVTLTVQFADGETYLDVTDNGRGFNTEKWGIGLSREIHLGLHGMQERAQLVGGTFSIRSTPQQGTTASISVPF